MFCKNSGFWEITWTTIILINIDQKKNKQIQKAYTKHLLYINSPKRTLIYGRQRLCKNYMENFNCCYENGWIFEIHKGRDNCFRQTLENICYQHKNELAIGRTYTESVSFIGHEIPNAIYHTLEKRVGVYDPIRFHYMKKSSQIYEIYLHAV